MKDKKEQAADDQLQSQREMIRSSLNEIAAELNSALVAAGLACPVYVSVPFSGDSLVTFATPLDPNDDEWDRVIEITRRIVGERIGATRLNTRHLACAMAGTLMGAAEVAVG
jgi:hypothetical protein